MPPGRRPTYRTHSRAGLERWYREVRCPTCDALPGAVCRDLRTPHTDRTLPLSHKVRQTWRVQQAMNPSTNFTDLVKQLADQIVKPPPVLDGGQWIALTNARMKITPLIEKETQPKMEREEVIRQRIRELEDELALRTRYGRDVYEDGTVLSWLKTYPSQPDVVYRFAAIKSNGDWYVTGKDKAPRNWEGLTDYWLTADVVEVVQVLRVGSVIGVPQPQTDLEKSVAASTPPPAKEAGE